MLQLPLNIASEERQSFLDYLNLEILKKMPTAFSTGAAMPDGSFEITTKGNYLVDGNPIPQIWTVKISPTGSLSELIVTCDDPTIPASAWELDVSKFVNLVTASALSKAMGVYFRRILFYYIGIQLDGEYWLPGSYRFAPVIPDDPAPFLLNAERVVCIDHKVTARDDNQASLLAIATARRHAARLSLLLNHGLYDHDQAQRWFYSPTEGESKSMRAQLGYFGPDAVVVDMPKKGDTCPRGQFAGQLNNPFRIPGKLLSLPPEARKILRRIDEAPAAVKESFDQGARLYQVGAVCGRMFPSVGLAYRVAAVEAISKADPTVNSFSAFMRKYVHSRTDIERELDHLYGSVRSGHFHAGQFPLGEYNEMDSGGPFMNMESAVNDQLNFACQGLVREAVVNWLVEMLPEVPEHNE